MLKQEVRDWKDVQIPILAEYQGIRSMPLKKSEAANRKTRQKKFWLWLFSFKLFRSGSSRR